MVCSVGKEIFKSQWLNFGRVSGSHLIDHHLIVNTGLVTHVPYSTVFDRTSVFCKYQSASSCIHLRPSLRI